MRVAYVAGPYRAPTENGVWENIAEARAIALALWKKGYAVICPHTNTAFFGIGAEHDHMYLEGDQQIIQLLRSGYDCVVMMPKWTTSKGAAEERRLALELDLRVYYWPDVPDAAS